MWETWQDCVGGLGVESIRCRGQGFGVLAFVHVGFRGVRTLNPKQVLR